MGSSIYYGHKNRVIKKIKLPKAYQVSISPAGDRLVSLGRTAVMVDALGRKRLWSSKPLSHPMSSDFSRDGARLVIKNTSGRIVIVDADSAEVINEFENQKEGEGAPAMFSNCGQYLVDASWQGELTVRNSYSGERVMRQSHPGEMITKVSCAPCGSTGSSFIGLGHGPERVFLMLRTRPSVNGRSMEWPQTSSCI